MYVLDIDVMNARITENLYWNFWEIKCKICNPITVFFQGSCKVSYICQVKIIG